MLTIYHGTNQIAQTQLYLSITGVEQMFRSKTIMLNPTSESVADRLADADVPNEPDTTAKNFVFMHGYNVKPQEARGVAADMFKRMYWSGSHAKFWAVTWEGAESKISDKFTPNYHTNVVNAFKTAPALANFIASLSSSGPVVATAHSLGNMLTLSAINDWNAPISQYFMLDAAVSVEAIDPAATTDMMVYSTWKDYSSRLYASEWYKLFSTDDYRRKLSWNNRLGNLRNVDVYNFYSSGEDVLRTYTADPPTDMLTFPVGSVYAQIKNHFWNELPWGTYSWYWQEKGKGACQQDWLLGSSHGGWKFNTYWVNYWGATLSPAVMNDTLPAILQDQPMFSVNSTANQSLWDLDFELPSPGGSTYAQANRNRILADAIPAMSVVAGANPIAMLNQPGQPHNIDMMSLKNGWSSGRTGVESGMWHHSDFVQMAYTYTYKLFDKLVMTGNLK